MIKTLDNAKKQYYYKSNFPLLRLSKFKILVRNHARKILHVGPCSPPKEGKNARQRYLLYPSERHIIVNS